MSVLMLATLQSLTPGLNVEYLAVGGGSGGNGGISGSHYGSGGAAGVVRSGTLYLPPASHAITVGNGSNGTKQAPTSNAGASSIGSYVTAPGGLGVSNAIRTGASNADYVGGTRTSGTAGGGGAGAGGNGTGHNGGPGVSTSITGSPQTFGGGGGGGSSGPSGGAGAGAGSSGVGGNATANSGSGGGGGGSVNGGGNGGSGCVIIRYAGPQRATGGTVTSVGGYTVHTFTASGAFVVA